MLSSEELFGVPGSKVTVAPCKPFSLASFIPSPSLSNQTISPIEPKLGGVTVKVTSLEVAAQEPSAAIVYLIVTEVSVLMLPGVYMFPLIDPPPETIDQVPPFGAPINVLVSSTVIVAVDVVLSATILQIGVTVKVTSLEVAAQEPSAAIVYLIVTLVFVLILSGV